MLRGPPTSFSWDFLSAAHKKGITTFIYLRCKMRKNPWRSRRKLLSCQDWELSELTFFSLKSWPQREPPLTESSARYIHCKCFAYGNYRFCLCSKSSLSLSVNPTKSPPSFMFEVFKITAKFSTDSTEYNHIFSS